MVKLRVTEVMRGLLPSCTELQESSEIEYKTLKSTAKAAQIPLSSLLKGTEFIFPTQVAAAPEPQFIQQIKQKRLIKEYEQMTANVSLTAKKSDYAETMQGAAFSATMVSLLFLSFLAGYFIGLLFDASQYTRLVLGFISLVVMMYLEVGMYILKTEKVAYAKKRQ